MSVYFQKPFADGEKGVPYTSARKEFAAPTRCLYTHNTTDDILQPALLLPHKVSVTLQDIQFSFYPYQPVKNVSAATGVAGHTRQEYISSFRQTSQRRQNDTVFVSFDEWPHTDAGRRETHFFLLVQQASQFRNEYVVFYSNWMRTPEAE